jgi:hypothetical protein
MTIRPYCVALAIVLTTVSGLSCDWAQEQNQEQKPLIALEPGSGPPESTVVAKGSGFRGDCRVRLSLAGESFPPLGSADVDRSGAFSAEITIPAQASEGEHIVLVEGLRPGTQGCEAPSDNRAQATFVVHPGETAPPALTIDTVEARPGSTVRVAGRGFCAETGCSTVTVLIDGQVGARDVKVIAGGTFSAEARVPAINTAGRIAVAAVQTLADGTEIRAFGELEVTPRPNVRRQPGQ